jgi:hypothetical protein
MIVRPRAPLELKAINKNTYFEMWLHFGTTMAVL